MDKPNVFGLLGDRGWIIERLAADIAEVCPNFSYGTTIEGRPDIVYYMTYAARKAEYDGIEVGYFTHIEEGLPEEQKFYDIAQEVDHCVTQASRYERILRDRGVAAVSTIPPGIDHAEFFPRLRVGVVGRTYHTNRKGETVVAPLMDMEEVEFVFTGDGWPGPSRPVPPGEMGNFYRSLDYVLVPALYEGGPMCVPEALACGTPVIAPSDIGWVEDFPHVSFPKDDSEALRKVLRDCAREKIELAQSAAGHTSRRWGEMHGDLFDRLWREAGAGSRRAGAPTQLSSAHVGQVMHGGERTSKGGPTVRVPYTAEQFAPLCQTSEVFFGPPPAGRTLDIAHFYNIWQPPTALALSRSLRDRARLQVFSPILLDLSLRPFWEVELMDCLQAQPPGETRFADALPALQRKLATRLEDRDLARLGYQPVPGFVSMLRDLVEGVDHVVFLSEFERDLALAMGASPGDSTVLRNPVDASFFTPAGPEAEPAEAAELSRRMRELAGLEQDEPFLLNVGRVEVRKNQLAVAEIARRSGLPLVIAGHEGARGYADMVREVGGDNVRGIGRVEPHSEELRWLYRNCSAFLSLSWAEGASLAVLEAAATGAPLLLADTSSEREYFGEIAQFCDPLEVDKAVELLPAAMAAGDPESRATRHSWMRDRYDWSKHVSQLAEIYQKILSDRTGGAE